MSDDYCPTTKREHAWVFEYGEPFFECYYCDEKRTYTNKMDRDQLLAFATWLADGEHFEGREAELVDKYIAEHPSPAGCW